MTIPLPIDGDPARVLAGAGFDRPVSWWSEDAAVDVRGADAQTYLHGQLSADVTALTLGGSADTLLLDPTGKLVAVGWLIAEAADHYRLMVPGANLDEVTARLARFRLRVEADLDARTVPVLHRRGPGDASQASGGRLRSVPGGFDVVFEDERAARAADGMGARVLDPVDVDRVRVALGELAFGRDVNGGAIPAELGESAVARSASFDKGCYVGQELVARVESRGSRAPRRPCRVWWQPDASTAELVHTEAHPRFELRDADSEVVGSMATDAPFADTSDRRGLALIGRRVGPGDSVDVWLDDARVGHGHVEILAPDAGERARP